MEHEQRREILIEPGRFRAVLGHLPTGVTVVTAHGPHGPIGMACNSVTSASLDPPLVAFLPAKSSSTWPLIRAAGRFCISVMASHHEQATRAFSQRGIDRFAGVEVVDRAGGPGLAEAVAWIDCVTFAEHDAGDHTLVLGSVVSLDAHPDRPPLVFFRGNYSALSPPRTD